MYHKVDRSTDSETYSPEKTSGPAGGLAEFDNSVVILNLFGIDIGIAIGIETDRKLDEQSRSR